MFRYLSREIAKCCIGLSVWIDIKTDNRLTIDSDNKNISLILLDDFQYK